MVDQPMCCTGHAGVLAQPGWGASAEKESGSPMGGSRVGYCDGRDSQAGVRVGVADLLSALLSGLVRFRSKLSGTWQKP